MPKPPAAATFDISRPPAPGGPAGKVKGLLQFQKKKVLTYRRMLFIFAEFWEKWRNGGIINSNGVVAMKITVRGWGRDMGEKEIANHYLLDIQYKDNGTVYRSTPVIYDRGGNTTVSWYQPLRFTGDYRMDVQFSRSDIMKLFKCAFGSVLNENLFERYGLSVSPELRNAILRTVKLSDLTLGDLAAMNAAPESEETESKPEVKEPAKVPSILRRV
jgi:hypothetical protein